MNHNSSRFGKYTELKFNDRGAVVGAQVDLGDVFVADLTSDFRIPSREVSCGAPERRGAQFSCVLLPVRGPTMPVDGIDQGWRLQLHLRRQGAK